MNKINYHEITPLLFQPVGNVKVFFYVPIKLIYLSPYDGNRDCFVLEIVKNCALSGRSMGSFPTLGIYSPGPCIPDYNPQQK